MWNRAFFRTIRVRDGKIANITYEEPFASLLGSHKSSMVDQRGHYSNLPISRMLLRRLRRNNEFRETIGHLHRRILGSRRTRKPLEPFFPHQPERGLRAAAGTPTRLAHSRRETRAAR